jgi:hypothetical protein
MPNRSSHRWLVVSCLLICCSIPNFGCEQETDSEIAATPLGPIASFSRTEIDLGRIPFELNLHKSFSISVQNQGDEPLQIGGFQRSCGCTQLKISKYRLLPGETAEISGSVTISDEGERLVGISVQTNCRGTSSHNLGIRWDAVLPVTVNPRFLEFGLVEPGKEYVKVVQATADPGFKAEPVSVVGVYDSREEFLSSTQAGSQVSVTLTGPKETGVHHAFITVSFPDVAKSIRIPVSCEVRNPVSVVPASIHVGNVAQGIRLEKKILLRTVSPLADSEMPSVHVEQNIQPVVWSRSENGMLLGHLSILVPDECGPFTKKFVVSTSLGDCNLTCSGFVEARQ